MTWMLTAHGTSFDLEHIALDAISIDEIAHHLAQINRFTGACSRPYSVAEHSLLVCDIMEREHGAHSPSLLMAGLLHDAHEAYTSDLSSPMKQVIGPAWAIAERRVQRAVQQRFNILVASTAQWPQIHRADMTALLCERRDLLPQGGPSWPAEAQHRPLDWVNLRARDAFTWQDWRQAFLDKFHELRFARELKATAINSAVRAT